MGDRLPDGVPASILGSLGLPALSSSTSSVVAGLAAGAAATEAPLAAVEVVPGLLDVSAGRDIAVHGDLVTHAGRGPPVEVRYSADASSLGALALDLLDHRTSTTPFGTRTTLVVPQKPALSPPAGATLFFLTFALPRSDGSHAVTGTVAMRPTAAAVPGADLSDLLCTGRVAAGDFLSGGAHVLGGTLVAASTVDAAGSGTGVPGPGGVAVAGRGDAVGVCGGNGAHVLGGTLVAVSTVDAAGSGSGVPGPGGVAVAGRGDAVGVCGGNGAHVLGGTLVAVSTVDAAGSGSGVPGPGGVAVAGRGDAVGVCGGNGAHVLGGTLVAESTVDAAGSGPGGPGPGGVTVNGYSLQAAGFVPTLLR